MLEDFAKNRNAIVLLERYNRASWLSGALMNNISIWGCPLSRYSERVSYNQSAALKYADQSCRGWSADD